MADRRVTDKLGKEIQFLAAFYSQDSGTKGNRVASALEAGWSKASAQKMAERTLEKWATVDFKKVAEAVGLTNAALALRVKQIVEGEDEKASLAAMKMLLANRGETTEGAPKNAPVINFPVMVIQGMNEEKLRALKAGYSQAPELPPLDEPQAAETGEIVEAAEAVEETKIVDAEVVEEVKPPAPNPQRLTVVDFKGRLRGNVGR